MSRKLTSRQKEILSMIEGFFASHGRPPTRQEIADYFGFASSNASQKHVVALHKKGVLTINPGKHRGLTVAQMMRVGRHEIAGVVA